ncbi:hypothetical protein TRFO_12337 [Tritrichomonas foetus]|uniref:Uncharacterized protein n=1 Tax=Tritrichomonas foetus TaxID=1144522 RepID=A0A1J4J3N6_9EUKA|nr:hypothetical protein TRFO_12337 [Tritrichomonas foetus]|eukprot:OHS92775.1 hypothetical protein TRFO_12337 [Tritrichomonas foetus]
MSIFSPLYARFVFIPSISFSIIKWPYYLIIQYLFGLIFYEFVHICNEKKSLSANSMISIKTNLYRNTPNILELNRNLIQIQNIVSTCQQDPSIKQDTKGLLTILYCITLYAKKNQIAFPHLCPIGLVLFNDRILINPFILGIFIDWDEEVLKNVLAAPEFHSRSLTRSQFTSLMKLNYLNGSIFDWRLHVYPPCQISNDIISEIFPSGGESFFLAADQTSNLLDDKPPKLCLMTAKILDESPSKSIWIVYKNQPMEDILLKFADTEPAPGKCWLFYKNET